MDTRLKRLTGYRIGKYNGCKTTTLFGRNKFMYYIIRI